ncbi:MAG: glycosyltransferase, partial [Nanopusillaceae archaeon]
VIIPTFNSEKTIDLAVRSALEITDDVIVVDSFSKDKTVEIAEKEGAKVIQIKGSRLIARIEGCKIAKGDYIINLDSDMYFTEKFKEYIENNRRKSYFIRRNNYRKRDSI